MGRFVVVAMLCLSLTGCSDESSATDATVPPPSSTVDDARVAPQKGGTALDGYADLIAIEARFDPQQSVARFVCANKGDNVVKFVEGHEPPPNADVDPSAGPLVKGADPCSGYDWVVGR